MVKMQWRTFCKRASEIPFQSLVYIIHKDEYAPKFERVTREMMEKFIAQIDVGEREYGLTDGEGTLRKDVIYMRECTQIKVQQTETTFRVTGHAPRRIDPNYVAPKLIPLVPDNEFRETYFSRFIQS
ncbi:hypothetical protein [Nostoc sp.]